MRKVSTWAAVVLMAGIAPPVSAQHAGHAHMQHQAPAQQPPTHDQLRMAVQQICPVSGQKLGEHGQPIKAKIGEEQVFLCCQGCLKGKVDPQHWATIHGNAARAQAQCPVMGKPLPKNPKSTIVEGQTVYICCPPCAEKIAAAPQSYLRKVDELYSASLKAQQSER